MALVLLEQFESLDIILLRHATAENDDGGGDADRALTAEGIDEAARCGRFLESLKDDDDAPFHLICSAAKRTRMTAGRVKENAAGLFGAPEVQEALYNTPESAVFYAVQEAALKGRTRIAVVAHNPGVSDACRDILKYCPEEQIVANGRYLPLLPCRGMMFRVTRGMPEIRAAISPDGLR